MADVNNSLKEAMEIDGAIGVALVDWDSGMTLGTAGGNAEMDMDVAAAGNTEVVRSKMAAMKSLGLAESIEDILITLDHQYHLIRPLSKEKGLFLYVAVYKDKANLAMTRRKLANIEGALDV